MNQGLLAYGKEGSTEVELTEFIDCAERYELSISNSSAVQNFTFTSPQILNELIQFLENEEMDELGISASNEGPTSLKKDDEFLDRAFLRTYSKKEKRIAFEITLSLPDLLSALKQASTDL